MRYLFIALMSLCSLGIFAQEKCGFELSEKDQKNLRKTLDDYRFNRVVSTQNASTSNVRLVAIKPYIFRDENGENGPDISKLEAELLYTNTLFAPSLIQFYFLEKEFIDGSSYYDFDQTSEQSTLFSDFHVASTLNLYLVNEITRTDGSDVCGYAYYNTTEGITATVIENACIRGDVLGTTLPHELGHLFSLYHTHGKTNFGTTDELVDGSNCATAGDELCDTPADPNLIESQAKDCSYTGTFTDANGDTFSPLLDNIMSYGRDRCQDAFTQDQYDRMVAASNSYLAGHQSTSSALLASFKASNRDQIFSGDQVDFMDLSHDAVSWSWNFEGGSPSTSSTQNPSITYTSAGKFDVSLTITNGSGEQDEFIFPEYIAVDPVDITHNTPDGWDAPARFYVFDQNETRVYQTSFEAGDNVFMEYGVKNEGLADALDSTFRVNIYVNNDLKRWNTFLLSAGGTSFREDRELGLLPPGTNEIRIEFDAENDYPEFDETNNTYITTLEVSEPDIMSADPVSPIAGIEYFIDDIVGFGEGTLITTTSGNDVTLDFTVPMDGLSSGLHKLYTRALNQAGRWGQTSKKNFYVVPTQDLSLRKSEYFFDTDPGYGLANPIVLTEGESNHSIDLTGISDGYHRLYVRSQNNMGRWSVTQNISFIKVGQKLDPRISKLVYRFYDYSTETYSEFVEVPIDPAVDQYEEILLLDNSTLVDGENYAVAVYAEDENGIRSKMEAIDFIYQINVEPTIADQAFSIDENSEQGTIIGSVVASDDDGDDLTFSILTGNTSDAFALSTTGELTVQTSSELDYEATQSFSLEVEVNDGNGGTAQATITINLNDVDESSNTAPTIADQTFIIDENSPNETSIGSIEASDDDGDDLTFSILSGNNNDAFALSTTGELTVQTSSELDFEATQSFSLEVEVNDGNGGTDQGTITINLNDVFENTPPTIANQAFSIDENSANETSVGSVIASDTDGDDLTFSILSGNTNDAFALSATGELTVQTSTELDFETTQSFSLEVEVNDGNGGTAQATITINLNDVDESTNTNPTIAAQTFSIDENSANGTIVGSIVASDADSDDLTFSITSGNTNDAFALSTTGELTVQNSSELDYETTQSFSLEVEVSDGNGGIAQATITINLNDVDENNSPTIADQSFSIDENTANSILVGQIVATDDDGDNLNFSILSGNTNDAFALSTAGELTVQTSTALDFETTPMFSLEVEVNDGAGGADQATITINLNDVFENTNPTIADQAFSIDENSVNGTIVGSIVASDDDGDNLTFSILSGNTNDAFALSTAGELTVQSSTELDFETTPMFSLEVEVSDGNGGAASSTITIELNNIDETTLIESTFQLPENSSTGAVIGSVGFFETGTALFPYLEASSSEIDQDDEAQLKGIELINSGSIELSEDFNLVLSSSDALDFESFQSFKVIVKLCCFTAGSEPSTIITVEIINVNESTTIEDQIFSIDENSPSETMVGQIDASDEDGDALAFSILSGNANDAFALSATGELKVENSSELDFEKTPTFNLEVEVNDGNGGKAQATITINLNDVDETEPLSTNYSNEILTVFPNPSNGKVTLLLSEELHGELIQLFDFTGKLILDGLINENEISLNFRDQPDGVFILKIGDQKAIKLTKAE